MPTTTLDGIVTSAEVTVTAQISGAARRQHFTRVYQPESVRVRYLLTPGEGWRQLVSLSGRQVRKDGSLGTRKIDEFFLWEHEIPAWAADFANEYHPETGRVL